MGGFLCSSDEYSDRQTDRYGQTVTDRRRNRWIQAVEQTHKRGLAENADLRNTLSAMNNLVTKHEKIMNK